MKTLPHLLLPYVLLGAIGAAPGHAQPDHNPVIWADVPDPALLRVGDTYYMSSTTMHMVPGLPIMKSKDLLNWEILNYAHEVLADNDAHNLVDGQSAYGAGSWASSLRYHDGLYYVSTFAQSTGKTHVYTTPDIEHVPWKEMSFEPMLHDNSLFFDDDGRVYMLYGNDDFYLAELEPDASGLKPGGFHEVVIEDASAIAGDHIALGAEGAQLRKVDDWYYLLSITWPHGGMRTVLVHRAKSLKGPWEGRVALQDRGIAQGCLIDTPDGDWYAYLFQDSGAVGRIPYLVPVHWEDGWPVIGIDGKVPMRLEIDAENRGMDPIVASDDFTRGADEPALPLVWQWNHNPVDSHWSVQEAPGALRLTTSHLAEHVLAARNTLTQRTFGPQSRAETTLDISAMKPGDVAGLLALQRHYGFVAVERTDDGASLIMVNAGGDAPELVERIPLEVDHLHLRLHCDFRDLRDEATFAYSLDGQTWHPIGDTLQMSYTLPHFMGYRFGLFNYATKETGGWVDFEAFRLFNAEGEQL
ncbi:MAG: glycoside hydrolase 43 family protein [Opitutales bacterium]